MVRFRSLLLALVLLGDAVATSSCPATAQLLAACPSPHSRSTADGAAVEIEIAAPMVVGLVVGAGWNSLAGRQFEAPVSLKTDDQQLWPVVVGGAALAVLSPSTAPCNLPVSTRWPAVGL